jgi:hypothetical protein
VAGGGGCGQAGQLFLMPVVGELVLMPAVMGLLFGRLLLISGWGFDTCRPLASLGRLLMLIAGPACLTSRPAIRPFNIG